MSPIKTTQKSCVKQQRPIWFHLHFWMSWVVALPLLIVCLTGIALAFQDEFYRLEEPFYYDLDGEGREALALPEVLAIYESAEPPLHLNYLQVPQSSHAPYIAFAREIPRDGSEEQGLRALLNPYTGEIFRLYEDKTVIRFIEVLHRTLTLKKWGRWTVGASSGILAITSSIGLILWWPMRRKTFSRVVRRRRALDWHNALGLIGLLPLCVLAFTGMTFTWGKYLFPVLDQVQGKASWFTVPEVPEDLVQEDGTHVSMAEVSTQILKTYPEASITGVQDSRQLSRPYVYNLSLPGDVHPGGSLKLYVNPQDGGVFETFNLGETGPVGLYRRFFYILHTGHPFPWWGRLFWALSSGIGLILILTGCWMSIKRWRRKRS